MNYHNKVRFDFSNAAEEYNQHANLQKYVSSQLFKHSGFNLSKDSIILDGGCGTGFLKDILYKENCVSKLVQMDIAEKMCDIAAKNTHKMNIQTIQGNLESMPLLDKEFSHFYSSMALQWVDDLKTALSEINRILKENGQYAFSITGDGSLYELKQTFTQMDSLKHVNDFITKEKLENYLNKCGFNNFNIIDEEIVEQYQTPLSLIRNIKRIGARYKENRKTMFPGKQYFTKIEKLYSEKFSIEDKVKASWIIFYVTGTK